MTSSIDNKKQTIQKKKVAKKTTSEKVTSFITSVVYITIILAISFFITPPLLYGIQYLNSKTMKASMPYNVSHQDGNDNTIKTSYTSLNDFIKGEIKGDFLLNKDTMNVFKDAFKVGVAGSFFSARDGMMKLLEFMRDIMGVSHNLDITQGINKQLEELGKSETIIEKLLLFVFLCFTPTVIYPTLLFGPMIYSFFMGIFGFLQNLSIRSIIVIVILSFMTLFLLPTFGIPAVLFIFYLASIYNGGKIWGYVVTSINWLSKWANMPAKGNWIEYKTFAKNTREIYLSLFIISGIISLISTFS